MADSDITLFANVKVDEVDTSRVDTTDFQANISRALSNVKLPTEELGQRIQQLLSVSEKDTDRLGKHLISNLARIEQDFQSIGQQNVFNQMRGDVDVLRHKLEDLSGVINDTLRGYDITNYNPTGLEKDSNTVEYREPRPINMEEGTQALQQFVDILTQYDASLEPICEKLNQLDSAYEEQIHLAREAASAVEEHAEAVEADSSAQPAEVFPAQEVSHYGTLLSSLYDRLAQDGAQMKEAISSTFSDIGAKVSDVVSRTDILSHRFIGLIPNAKSLFGAIASGVDNAVSVGKKAGTLIASSMKHAGSAVGNLVSRFRQFGREASKTADQASKKMKRMTLQMIKAMLGVRGLYMLFRKMKSAISEAFQAMAQQVPEIGKTFNEFKTALNQIKGSIGTAFQPIISAVLPVLTQLLGMLNTVIEAVARFNAVLTGQKYIYKYTAAQQEYAKSVGGTGKAAKKATADLMGFDEINRLSAPNDNSGGGGSNKMGDYEQVDIDPSDAVSNFAEKVKKAWEEADFTEIGQIIGNNLKESMEVATSFFDTEGQKWAKHLSKSITTLINGLVSVPDLGKSIGTAIGSAINVGITFLRDFWRDTNFTGIGEQLAGAVNGLFDKVDWTGLGEYFGYKFNGIFDAINGFATNTNWSNIGTDIGNSLNTYISTMDLGNATASLSKALVGMLQSCISLITTTDWGAVGEEIADGLAGIDWSGVLGNAGTLISKGAQGILDMFINFVKKTNWSKLTKDILEGLGKMFENVWDDGALIQKLAEGFGALLGAALEVFWNIGGFIYDHVVVPLGEALSNEFTFDPDSPWYEVGWNIIQGILKGIFDALIGIGKWIADNIVQPIVDGICKAFGIASPSTVMMEIGGYLIDGLFEGLKGIWDAICGIFEDLKENILGIFDSIASGISAIWDGITSGVSAAWNGIKTTIVNIVSNIMNVVTGQFNNLKEGVLAVFRFIRDTAGLIWDGMCTVFTTVFENLWKILQEVFGKIVDFVQWVADKVQEIIDWLSPGNGVSDWVKTQKVTVEGAGSGVNIKIPHLASGAVLPPNQPFLSVVGDQSRGTNVEAPLDTIKQAVAEVMNENLEGMMAGFEAVVNAINSKDTTAVISYRAVGEANRKYNKEMETIRGY